MKLLISLLAVAGLSGCVGYVPYYGGDAYGGYATAPGYATGPAYAYPAPYYAPGYAAAPYYGPAISFGAIIGGGGYHRGYRREWRDGGGAHYGHHGYGAH
jgi:hypothetical protein